MMKFIYRSDDFYSFKDGVKLEDDTIQEMIDDITKHLLKNVEEKNNYYITGSGDTMIFGFMFDEDGDGVGDEINIFVARGYEHAEGWFDMEKCEWVKIDNWYEDKPNEYEQLLLEKQRIEAQLAKYPEYDPKREV